jgi:hypothetical protein
LHDTRVQPTRGNMPDPAGHPPRPRQLGPQTALQTAMSEADVHFCAIKKAHLLWARHRARTTYVVNRARLKCVPGTERLHGWRPPSDGRRVYVKANRACRVRPGSAPLRWRVVRDGAGCRVRGWGHAGYGSGQGPVRDMATALCSHQAPVHASSARARGLPGRGSGTAPAGRPSWVGRSTRGEPAGGQLAGGSWGRGAGGGGPVEGGRRIAPSARHWGAPNP